MWGGVKFLDSYPELGSLDNKDGNNCAHIAAFKGSIEVMKALMKSDESMAYVKNKITMGYQSGHIIIRGLTKAYEVLRILNQNPCFNKFRRTDRQIHTEKLTD